MVTRREMTYPEIIVSWFSNPRHRPFGFWRQHNLVSDDGTLMNETKYISSSDVAANLQTTTCRM